jgi:hypothetical protein
MGSNRIGWQDATACNDNGCIALLQRLAGPRDVLVAARLCCGRVGLSYVARGSMLIAPAGRSAVRAAA